MNGRQVVLDEERQLFFMREEAREAAKTGELRVAERAGEYKKLKAVAAELQAHLNVSRCAAGEGTGQVGVGAEWSRLHNRRHTNKKLMGCERVYNKKLMDSRRTRYGA